MTMNNNNNEQKKIDFINFLLPHVEAVFGKYMPEFSIWAIGKAGVECGWNTRNILITAANNCLGVKAVEGVPAVTVSANTGPEAGEPVAFRVFPNLTACFIEFANMLNFRSFWNELREQTLLQFEDVYVNHTVHAHPQEVLTATKEVHQLMEQTGIIDSRGRFTVFVA